MNEPMSVTAVFSPVLATPVPSPIAVPTPTPTPISPTPASPTPTPTPTPMPTPTTSVANDISGTPLSLSTTASSVVDKDLNPRDVYALSLTAGQEIQFTVTKQYGSGQVLTFDLASPGSQSFQTGNVTLAFSSRIAWSSTTWTRNFAPPVTGTYYFAITAAISAQTYTVGAVLTGSS